MIQRYYQNLNECFLIRSEKIHKFMRNYKAMIRLLEDGEYIEKSNRDSMNFEYAKIIHRIQSREGINKLLRLYAFDENKVYVCVYDVDMQNPDINHIIRIGFDNERKLSYLEAYNHE